MKKAVLIVIVISAIIVGGVLFAGFLNNQEEATQPNTQNTETTSTPTPQTETQDQALTESFTLAQVAQHNTPADCWIIIENSVYDVTEFLNEHPGGSERIEPFCGKDATEGFATQGGAGSHSSSANQLREDFLIGTVTN